MNMDGQPDMSMYDLMEANGTLPEGGLVLLTIRNGDGFVRSDTGQSVEVVEIKKGGFFDIPKNWDREDLPHYRIRGVAEHHKPEKGAEFYFPVFKGELFSGVQYYRELMEKNEESDAIKKIN